MKQEIKKSNIFITLVLLMLAIMCVTNVTYSYFTATETKDDSLNFGDLNVQFVYMLKGSPNEETTLNSGKIELYSVSGPIQRDVKFDLGVKQLINEQEQIVAIDYIAVRNLTGSCDCYARFWIDAFVVKNGEADETENYGKYFFWEMPAYQSFVRTTSEDMCYYYFKETLTVNSQSNFPIENSLILQDISDDDQVPAKILGESLKITLNIQAVQKANGAYMEIFSNDKNHYDWENRK